MTPTERWLLWTMGFGAFIQGLDAILRFLEWVTR